jgi:hypothetical protein
MTNEFNWNEAEDDVILAGQQAVAIYENPKGDTVIRQESDYTRDEDSIIIIKRNNTAAFVDALQQHLENQQVADT